MAKKYLFSNKTKNTTAQCKIIIYPWNKDLTDGEISDAELAGSSRLDISSQIVSATYSKNMGAAAGSFSFTLTNSPNYGSNDWKDIIKRGFWCLIYMSQDGDLDLAQEVSPAKPKLSEAKKIRCVGYIERAGVTGAVQENQSVDIGFTVTGRDFGIVYEETEIWHNMFQFDKIMLDSIAQTQLNVIGNVRLHQAIKTVHDLFYFPQNLPGAKVGDNKSLLSIGLQWLLPKEMMIDIGYNLTQLSKGTFWGAIPNNFEPEETGAGIAVDKPGDYLSGNAWEQLKRLSIPAYHELFCEMDDSNKPRLNFRPIPWGIDQSKYPMNSQKIKLYKDIPAITIPAVDLYEFDLAEDDHNRYNSFLATVSTGLINMEDNISLLLGKGFPKNNLASIRRHGFRPMHVTVDSIIKNEELGNGSTDQAQLVEFNEILYDYWNPMVFAESGSISKLGTNEIRVGKCIRFKDDVPYLSTKRYYIEGYTDSFNIGSNREASWEQEVNVTRGFEQSDLIAKKGFSSRRTEFSGAGEFTKANTGTK